jgi:hypothetical protein
MKNNLLIISLLLLYANINAQPENRYDSKHEFGLNAGFTTGVGFSYRYWPGKFGIQATVLPIKTESSWTDILDIQNLYEEYGINVKNKKMTSLGLTALLTLDEGKSCKFFSFLGNHYIIRDDGESYNIGLGIGFAVKAPVSFNLMAGYGAYDILGKYSLLPTIEFGLYYRFKHRN